MKKIDLNLALSLFVNESDLLAYGTGQDEKRFGQDGIKVQIRQYWLQAEKI